LLPFFFCRMFIDAELGEEIFDHKGFHWKPAVLLGLMIIWAPVALAITSMGTGYFSRPEHVEDSFLKTPVVDSYEI
jgi:hypothetical protein